MQFSLGTRVRIATLEYKRAKRERHDTHHDRVWATHVGDVEPKLLEAARDGRTCLKICTLPAHKFAPLVQAASKWEAVHNLKVRCHGDDVWVLWD
jgi:hypothetical protein